MLTQKRLKKLLRYDSRTGIFVWKVTMSSNVKARDIAGTINNRGYSVIGIDHKFYLSHRIAWLFVHGYTPENGLDHINRIKTDNRIKNLREVSQQCNMRNAKTPNNNTTGVKGVSWYKPNKKWLARISVGRKTKNLGYSDSKIEAACVRLAAEQCLNWSGCDSASSAYQYVQNNIQTEQTEVTK